MDKYKEKVSAEKYRESRDFIRCTEKVEILFEKYRVQWNKYRESRNSSGKV